MKTFIESCWLYMIIKKNKLNKKGIAGIEILTISLTVLILTIIFMFIILNSVKKEQYNTLKKDVLILENSIDLYSLDNDIKSMSLKELTDRNLISKIKNPFYKSGSNKYCDLYDSKIVVNENNSITSILKCGEYLIKKEKTNDKATIYKVSNWNEKNGNTEEILYNYSINGEDYFENYYNKEVFIYLFNKENIREYTDIESIQAEYEVKNKVFYRNEEKVKEL